MNHKAGAPALNKRDGLQRAVNGAYADLSHTHTGADVSRIEDLIDAKIELALHDFMETLMRIIGQHE